MKPRPVTRWTQRLLCFAAVALACAAARAGSIRYEFTGGSTIPTLVDAPAGMSASSLQIGAGMGSLFDNGGSADALRISGNDVGNSSATALSASAYLSFSVTIPAGVTVSLTSLGLDHRATNAVSYSNSRVFSSADGYDNVTADTIGVLGRTSAGSDTSVVSGSISLATPEANPSRGANVANGEFSNLTNQTITFYLPWIDGSSASSAYTDVDNLVLLFEVVSGFDPPVSVTAFARQPDASVRITFTGTNGRYYSLLATDDLARPLAEWTALTNGVLGASPVTYTDAQASWWPRRFYAAADPQTRIMCVGDSITEGGSTFSVYRLPLWQKLAAAGHSVEFVGSRVTPSSGNSLAHEGYGGKSAEYLASVLPTVFAAHPADIVLIHAGHNHFDTDNPPDGPVPLIVAATESMIDTCRSLKPNVKILLAQVITSLKLPKYSYIPALNVALADLAARKHTAAQPVVIVDQATGFDPAADTVSDLVHPNAGGAEKMAVNWFNALHPHVDRSGKFNNED